MSHRIAFLSVAAAALGAAALPHAASAADYDDGGQGPAVFHSRDDVFIDGDRARIEHRQDFRGSGGYGYRRAPGPVAFDERDPDRRLDPPGYGYGGREGGFGPERGYRRPVIVERPAYGDDRPVGYGPRFARPDGAEFGYGAPVPPYRAVSAPVYSEAYEGRSDLPDVGCTVQEAQSTTPAGWRKTVTHRTCYRR